MWRQARIQHKRLRHAMPTAKLEFYKRKLYRARETTQKNNEGVSLKPLRSVLRPVEGVLVRSFSSPNKELLVYGPHKNVLLHGPHKEFVIHGPLASMSCGKMFKMIS